MATPEILPLFGADRRKRYCASVIRRCAGRLEAIINGLLSINHGIRGPSINHTANFYSARTFYILFPWRQHSRWLRLANTFSAAACVVF